MPKLGPVQIEARKRLVEDAALTLFKQRGFHGVGLREIAREADLSLGNIYNYYPTKDAIWASILDRLHGEFTGEDSPLAAYFGSCEFPDDLEALGVAVGKMVAAHADYLTLIYVDIAEFGGGHVRPYYRRLAAGFEAALGERLTGLELEGGVDPVVAFTTVYMQFFNFLIIERMIGARGHLGLNQKDAVRALAQILGGGIRRKGVTQ